MNESIVPKFLWQNPLDNDCTIDQNECSKPLDPRRWARWIGKHTAETQKRLPTRSEITHHVGGDIYAPAHRYKDYKGNRYCVTAYLDDYHNIAKDSAKKVLEVVYDVETRIRLESEIKLFQETMNNVQVKLEVKLFASDKAGASYWSIVAHIPSSWGCDQDQIKSKEIKVILQQVSDLLAKQCDEARNHLKECQDQAFQKMDASHKAIHQFTQARITAPA